MTTRWLAMIVATAVAVGAGAWALRLFVPAGSAPTRTSTVDTAISAGSDQTRGVRADLPAAPGVAGDRVKLVGVVAPGASAAGSEWLALIAVDGKPARAFGVGAVVEGDIVLWGVSARGATLGPRGGGVTTALEVSPAPTTATATATAPVPTARPGPVSQLPMGWPMAPDDLSRLGSMHPPLPPETASGPPVNGNAESGDGSWTPPSGR